MKRTITILFAGLLLTACNLSDRRLIGDAETVVGEHPDSALLLLNKVKNLGRLSDEYVARYWLTTAQAHAATDQALSEDSAIVFALDFYRHQQPLDSVALRKARALAASYYYLKSADIFSSV